MSYLKCSVVKSKVYYAKFKVVAVNIPKNVSSKVTPVPPGTPETTAATSSAVLNAPSVPAIPLKPLQPSIPLNPVVVPSERAAPSM